MPLSSSSSKSFSTRFLPSDGIPEYNALLDNHLGKRREYLLGNRKSLELLQQTGVISRVQQDNPNQYVVYMTEKPIHRRKRLPPKLSSTPGGASSSENACSSSERPPPPWHQNGHHRCSSSGLRKSETTPHLMPSRYWSKQSQGVRSSGGDQDDDSDDRDEDEGGEDEQDDVSTSMAFKRRNSGAESGSSMLQRVNNNGSGLNPLNSGGGGGSEVYNMSSKFAAMKTLGRSLSTNALARQNHVLDDRDPAVLGDKAAKLKASDNRQRSLRSESVSAAPSQFRMRSKSVVVVPPHVLPLQLELRDATTSGKAVIQQGSQSQQQHQAHKKAPLKGTVEHLLESDASYMTQIRAMKDQLADLDHEKGRLDAEVAQIRKRLRGVNAVHENDVAVAHCSSIMQHRLSKAEEEYMKLLTAQVQVRKDVDRVRREILSLKKVRKKLEADIDDVRHMNATIEDRIRASKTTRNVVSGELVELEKKAELAAEEQRLNLPPEEAVVVDVEKLMSAVQERNSNRWSSRHASVPWASGIPHASPSTQLASPSGGDTSQSSSRAVDGMGSASKPLLAYRVRAHLVASNRVVCFLDCGSHVYLTFVLLLGCVSSHPELTRVQGPRVVR